MRRVNWFQDKMVLQRFHCEQLARCPYLPLPEEVMTAAAMGAVRGESPPLFYETALMCAHSLWLQGYPAQSLLLINRALGADLQGDESILRKWPLPYAAALWVMSHRQADQFIGNPRRHYQHLATRMVEPRKSQRAWRAWACWYLARLVFPDYPADEEQIRDEGVVEPRREEIVDGLDAEGIPGEVELWEEAVGPFEG